MTIKSSRKEFFFTHDFALNLTLGKHAALTMVAIAAATGADAEVPVKVLKRSVQQSVICHSTKPGTDNYNSGFNLCLNGLSLGHTLKQSRNTII